MLGKGDTVELRVVVGVAEVEVEAVLDSVWNANALPRSTVTGEPTEAHWFLYIAIASWMFCLIEPVKRPARNDFPTHCMQARWQVQSSEGPERLQVIERR